MIAAEKLEHLAPGDMADLPPLFPGMSKEPLRLVLLKREPNRVEFDLIYYGVRLCGLGYRKKGKARIWERKP